MKLVTQIVGPHLQGGSNRIGRDRLPPGLVSYLGDASGLNGAIAAMHSFVQEGLHIPMGRCGVVFDVVAEKENESYCTVLRRITADVNFAIGNIAGYRHVLDLEHIKHICNRHADPVAEQRHGQIAIVVDDLYRIPAIVASRNLTECRLVSGVHKLAYKETFSDGELTVVQEVRTGRKELATVTLFKHK